MNKEQMIKWVKAVANTLYLIGAVFFAVHVLALLKAWGYQNPDAAGIAALLIISAAVVGFFKAMQD